MPDGQIFLILHNIRSAYNVGSIFRTADATGVSKIYLCGYTPTPLLRQGFGGQAKVGKTALGAEKTIPWEQFKQTWRLLEKFKRDGIKIIALEQTASSKNIFEYNFLKQSIAIIVGHERKGLSDKILEYADTVVEIPMRGKKESLNVAVATGIALYAISEQKSRK